LYWPITVSESFISFICSLNTCSVNDWERCSFQNIIVDLPICSVFYFFVCMCYWGLNSEPTPWATPPTLCVCVCVCVCVWRVFRDWDSWTICPGWLRMMILLISVSWVAEIIGVSPGHPAWWCIFKTLILSA
jgi:hypothetical protein